MTHIGQSILIDTFLKQKKYDLELYASGIYPRIFTWIDSLFKVGEGTLGFLTKWPTYMRISERYALLRPLHGKRRTAPRGVSTRMCLPSDSLLYLAGILVYLYFPYYRYNI